MGNCKRCGEETENSNNICDECMKVKEEEMTITVTNIAVLLGEILIFELLVDINVVMIFLALIPASMYFWGRMIIFKNKISKFRSVLLHDINSFINGCAFIGYFWLRVLIAIWNALGELGASLG